MKVLLPVDGSDATKRMLGYLAAHDELLRGRHEFVFFTAVPPVDPRLAPFFSHDEMQRFYRDQFDRVLRPVMLFARQQGWNARAVDAIGEPVEAIAATVEVEKPDLLAMGSHGHTALGNLLLGSVATGVLARCRTPVLLVR